MTTTEKLARFETAQDTIGMMVAFRSAWIHKERQKAKPDVNKIALWQAEKNQYSDEEYGLLFDDTKNIERIIDTYAPIVKADFSKM